MSLENKEINMELLFQIAEKGCRTVSDDGNSMQYYCTRGCPVMQCGNFIEPWECHGDDRASKSYAKRIIKRYKLEKGKRYKTMAWNKIEEITK